MGRCLAEATWELLLPVSHFDMQRQAVDVTLRSR